MSPIKKLFSCFSSTKKDAPDDYGGARDLVAGGGTRNNKKDATSSPKIKSTKMAAGAGGSLEGTSGNTHSTAPLHKGLTRLPVGKKEAGYYNKDDDSSIPTVDPDYNHQSSNFSLSDAGGTIGSQSRSLANFTNASSAFGSAAITTIPLDDVNGEMTINPRGYSRPLHSHHFDPYNDSSGNDSGGNNNNTNGNRAHNNPNNPYNFNPNSNDNNTPNSHSNNIREELLEIYAPSGKLGVVVDTPSSSPMPVVHAIKDTCPIRDEIRVGDKLVAVDDEDVREMTAMQVSRLIGKKSGNEVRKLTIIRSYRGW
ncbi:hypothetical protein ACHAXS_010808 [Conticribra weissflogii]